MGTTENITGLLPTVIAGGIALKFTQGMLGKQRPNFKRAKRTKGKKNYPSNRYSPF